MVGSKKLIQEKLIDPAVKGTENLLESVNRTDSVKRVVVTGTVLVCCCDFSASKKDKSWTFDHTRRDETTSPTKFPRRAARMTRHLSGAADAAAPLSGAADAAAPRPRRGSSADGLCRHRGRDAARLRTGGDTATWIVL